MFLFIINLTLACKETYTQYEDIEIVDIIEPYGEDAVCNITVYQDNGINTILENGLMTQGAGANSLLYNYSVSELSSGIYGASIICDKDNSTFLSECKFNVESEGEKMYIAMAIIISVVIGILLYLGHEFKLLFFDITVGKGDEKDEYQISFIKYLFWLCAGWFTLALINVGIILSANNGAVLDATITVVYKSFFYLMWFLTAMWLIGFMYWVLQRLAIVGTETKYE